LQVDPAEGRYVSGPKGSYQPISGETLRTAAESEDKEQAYLAVAKRMPVRMRVKIDQRKLNKFLVECGNADLMLEVKQVRINPDASHILTGAAASTPARGGGGYGGGFRGGEGGGSFGSGSDTQEYPWDIVVEVYGIIYIFNPPSLQRLQLTADEAAEFDREAARYSSSPAGEAADGPAADDQPADDERDEEGPGGPPAAAAPPAEAARNETPAADAAS
ncbi:hypothetical protein KDL45_17740, partial [bacterium]|nr:hypothetical protein [bacterium]